MVNNLIVKCLMNGIASDGKTSGLYTTPEIAQCN